MTAQSLYHTFKRYKTLHTDRIAVLPVVILMPHSACNCRCIMCDIWKDNKNLKQLTIKDVEGLMSSFKKFETQEVVMSGGEALLNPNFFLFCELLKKEKITVTLLSTGLTLKQHAAKLLQFVDKIIVSLDGDQITHDTIRNIPGAFDKLKEGVTCLKGFNPSYPISGRTVIHRLNFSLWPRIIEAAKDIGLDQISFLPADVSSTAFNRDTAWEPPRQDEILIEQESLPELLSVIQSLKNNYKKEFDEKFIAESPEKIHKIYWYYAAFYGLNPFPDKQCNAPWVSTVIEADGTVRPCFFHEAMGNIHEQSLSHILNSHKAVDFRKKLDMETNNTCIKCVCYLNLLPRTNLKQA